MARVKALVNNVPKKIIQSQVKLEGERAIDESNVVFPACVSVCTGDNIRILQDAVDLSGLVGMYNFQGCVIDESGLCHNGYGSISSPRKDMDLIWCSSQSIPKSNGYRDLCLTGFGCISCAPGKVYTKAINFDGCNDYITITPEEVFDIDQTTTFSYSAWLKTSDTCSVLMAKKATSTTDKGFEINLDSCGRVHLVITNTSCSNELNVRSDKSVNSCTWTHVAVTYSGIPGCGGSAINIYVNGDLDTKGVVVSSLSSCTLNNTNVSIGSYANGSSKFTGVMDDVSFWVAKTLSSEQIRSVFNVGILDEINGRTGFAKRFNGIDSFSEIPYTTDHDFVGPFDIQVWARWTTSSLGYLYARRNLSGNGFALAVNRIATGDIVAEIDGNLIKTCGETFNDDAWHFIRVYRDVCNTVHLQIDNVEKNSFLVASNLTLTSPSFFIGTNHNKTSYFAGDINTIRIYKNVDLNTEQITRIYSCVTSTSVLKFGGSATKVTKEIIKKTVVALSFGQSLGTTEVRAQEYNCRTPEYIIEDLIRANTDLIPHIHGTCSGIIISRFNADGKLIDIIRDLTQLTGRTFFTDGLNQFHLHDTAFRLTDFVFEHGVNSRNFECVKDDTEIVNDLLVIGEVKTYNTTCSFNGNGSCTVFTLLHGAKNAKVTVSGTEKVPEQDYETCVINKTITFTCAPPSGTNNIVVDYDYDLPLLIRGEKSSSVSLYGRYSKRLVMPWIKTRNDGIRFINGYLNRFKEIRASLKIELPVMKNSLNEGDVVRLINDVKGIDNSYVVKSLTWRYPEMDTQVLVGEFKFDDLEYEKQIIEKLHDLESALTEVKELRCSEQLEEILCLTDVVNIISGDACSTIFIENMCLADCISIQSLAPGYYNISIYGSGDIYGQIPEIAGFTQSGFTKAGFMVPNAGLNYKILLEPRALPGPQLGDAILKEDGSYIVMEQNQ